MSPENRGVFLLLKKVTSYINILSFLQMLKNPIMYTITKIIDPYSKLIRIKMDVINPKVK